MLHLWPHLRFGFAIVLAAIFSLVTAQRTGDAQKTSARPATPTIEHSTAATASPRPSQHRDRLADVDRD